MNALSTYFHITIIALLLTPQITSAQCHLSDRIALKAIYESTNGDDWVSNEGWNTHIANHSSPPANCNLEDLNGVDLEDGRVVVLNLSHKKLSGTLPTEIGNLTNLRLLNLAINKLSGTIPPEMGNSISLDSINLVLNNLTGAIPKELGDLTGNIPPELGKLINLKNLDFYFNHLTGSIKVFV